MGAFRVSVKHKNMTERIGNKPVESADKWKRDERREEVLVVVVFVVIVDEMPLKSALTRIPGIVFYVGNIASREWEPGHGNPHAGSFRSHLLSYPRSLPGAFLISHCRRSSCLLLREQHRAHPRQEVTPAPFAPLTTYPPLSRHCITDISVMCRTKTIS